MTGRRAPPAPRAVTTRRACVAGLLSLAVPACARGTRPVGPADAPTIRRPEELLPADLDLVLRLDLERIRAAIGPERFAELVRAHATPAVVAAGRDPFVDAALVQARTVWLAVRPNRRLELVDGVLVLAGTFRDLDPREGGARPAWSGPADRGGDVRVHERSGPVARSAPARAWLRSSDLVVVATAAEIDSVERALEGRGGGPRLEPPARGALSVAARVRPFVDLVRRSAPLVGRALEDARELTGWADLDADGLDGEFELRCSGPAAAAALADLLTAALPRLAEEESAGARFLEALRPRAVADRVVVSLGLDLRGLGALAECLAAGRC